MNQERNHHLYVGRAPYCILLQNYIQNHSIRWIVATYVPYHATLLDDIRRYICIAQLCRSWPSIPKRWTRHRSCGAMSSRESWPSHWVIGSRYLAQPSVVLDIYGPYIYTERGNKDIEKSWWIICSIVDIGNHTRDTDSNVQFCPGLIYSLFGLGYVEGSLLVRIGIIIYDRAIRSFMTGFPSSCVGAQKGRTIGAFEMSHRTFTSRFLNGIGLRGTFTGKNNGFDWDGQIRGFPVIVPLDPLWTSINSEFFGSFLGLPHSNQSSASDCTPGRTATSQDQQEGQWPAQTDLIPETGEVAEKPLRWRPMIPKGPK